MGRFFRWLFGGLAVLTLLGMMVLTVLMVLDTRSTGLENRRRLDAAGIPKSIAADILAGRPVPESTRATLTPAQKEIALSAGPDHSGGMAIGLVFGTGTVLLLLESIAFGITWWVTRKKG